MGPTAVSAVGGRAGDDIAKGGSPSAVEQRSLSSKARLYSETLKAFSFPETGLGTLLRGKERTAAFPTASSFGGRAGCQLDAFRTGGRGVCELRVPDSQTDRTGWSPGDRSVTSVDKRKSPKCQQPLRPLGPGNWASGTRSHDPWGCKSPSPRCLHVPWG